MANRLQIALELQTRQFNDALKQSRQAASEMTGEILNGATKASIALSGLSYSGGKILKTFIGAAAEVQNYQAALRALTGSAGAAEQEFKKLQDFATKTPFELPGVIEAGIKLRSLGAEVDRFLPIAGNLAAIFNRDIPDAAAAVGQVASGAQQGIERLSDSFGISRKTLIEYGAASGEAGSVSLKTSKDVEKALQAIEKFSKAKGFDNAMEERMKTIAGQASNLQDAIFKLSASLGEALVPTVGPIVSKLTELVTKFNELGPTTKSIIATSLLFGTTLATVGAGVSGLIALFSPLVGAIGSATVAMQAEAVAATTVSRAALIAEANVLAAGEAAVAAATGLSGAGAAATGAAGGFAAMASAALPLVAVATAVALITVKLYEAKIAADEAANAYQEKMTKAVGQTTEEALRLDKVLDSVKTKGAESAKAIQDAIKSTGQRPDQAYNDSLKESAVLREKIFYYQEEERKTQEQINKLSLRYRAGIVKGPEFNKRNAELQTQLDFQQRAIDLYVKQRVEVLKVTSATRPLAEASKAAAEEQAKQFERARKAYEEFKNATSAGEFLNPRAELNALDAIIGKLDQTSEEYKKAFQERRKLAVQVAKYEKQQAIDAALFRVEKEKAAGKEVLGLRIKVIDEILAREDLTVEEQRRYELEKIEAVKESVDQRLALEREFNDRRREIQKGLKQEIIDGADIEIKALERRLERGEDVIGQIQKEITKRREAAEEEARLNAESEKTGARRQFQDEVQADPSKRAELQRQLNDKLAVIEQDLNNTLKGIRNESAEDARLASEKAQKIRVEAAQKALKTEQDAAEERLNVIRQEFEERERIIKESGKPAAQQQAELKNLSKERTAAEAKGIKELSGLRAKSYKLEQEAANIGATNAEQARNQTEYETRISAEKRKQVTDARDLVNSVVNQTTALQNQTQEIRNQNAELDKRSKYLKDELGPIQAPTGGFDTTSFESTDEQFKQQRADQRAAEEEKKQAAKDAQKARSEKARIERETGLKTTLSDNSTPTIDDKSRPVLVPSALPEGTDAVAYALEKQNSYLERIARATEAKNGTQKSVPAKPGDDEDSILVSRPPRRGL